MKIAVYLRTSTLRQAQAQSCDQQLDRLQTHIQSQGWLLPSENIFRDDGFSGASLKRPGLDRLRDFTTTAALDRILITAPDRLARNYVHQVLLLEELQRAGCQVDFLDRPMSQDPHDQLLQIRGAVAEYERTLIAERRRRGRLAKLRAGLILPSTRPLTAIGSTPSVHATRRSYGSTRPRRPWSSNSSPGIANRVAACSAWPDTSRSWASPHRAASHTGVLPPCAAS